MTELKFLGTGTSQGVPIIACPCRVCSSGDSRDKRFRASALVRHNGKTILIDAGPDFRMQMIGAGVKHLDAILLTHFHRDHTGGLDDVRAFNYIDKQAVQIYCEEHTLGILKEEYAYAFSEHKYPGSPEFAVHIIDERPFSIEPPQAGELVWIHDVGYGHMSADGSFTPTDNETRDERNGSVPQTGKEVADAISEGKIIPIRGMHDKLPVLGFRIGAIAYITDMSELPESEFVKLNGLKHLTLNTVGRLKHHSHFSLGETLELADKIGAEKTWLTHLSHAFPPHEEFAAELEAYCREHRLRSAVQPAFDGLVIKSV